MQGILESHTYFREQLWSFETTYGYIVHLLKGSLWCLYDLKRIIIFSLVSI